MNGFLRNGQMKYARLKKVATQLTGTSDFAATAIGVGAAAYVQAQSLKQLNVTMTGKLKALLCLMVLEKTFHLIAWFMNA
ncbi:hypothetical protein D918_06792 [Trichuris suis]|nr:hypothetical protein D918_06792 [Trichuris suis]